MKMNEQAEPGRKELREFGVVTGLIVVVLFGLLVPWIFFEIRLLHTYDLWGLVDPPATFLRWPFVLGGVLATWGLVAPMSLRGVYRGWMKFGEFMGSIMNPLIMGAVFYLMFAPIGLVMKLLGKDPMARKWNADAGSYRSDSRENPPQNLEKPY